jgi:hypothetical protein
MVLLSHLTDEAVGLVLVSPHEVARGGQVDWRLPQRVPGPLIQLAELVEPDALRIILIIKLLTEMPLQPLPVDFQPAPQVRQLLVGTRSVVTLLTPPSIVAALRAGYRPLVHPSAGATSLRPFPA